MLDKQLDKMTALYERLKPFLRVQPGRYDKEWGFHPGHLGGEDEVRDYNRHHIRQVNWPRRYILWSPQRIDLNQPTFEEFLEAYNAG